MVIIWGANFSVVKVAMRDFPELAFNALRLVIGSSIFGVAIWWTRRRLDAVTPRLTRADWLRLIALGVIGHFAYQLFFLGGVKRTSVGNGSLIIGSSPVVIALLSSLAGHERVTPLRWLGVLLALGGLYLVVGHRVDWSRESLVGDALMVGSLLCWADLFDWRATALEAPLAAHRDRRVDEHRQPALRLVRVSSARVARLAVDLRRSAGG